MAGKPLVTFLPGIDVKCLRHNSHVGWGEVRVGVIDSGVTGVSCSGKKDFTGTGLEDVFGHGSRVAAIIKEVARASQIISLKVGNDAPDELAVIQALEWAIENKVHVVNISSAFERHNKNDSCPICSLIETAVSKGMIVIVAAGNNTIGAKLPTINCPGFSDAAVTVSAVNKQGDNIADYACIGETDWNKPNLLASGSCYYKGKHGQGTSFSAPVVAGTCAAILYRVKDSRKVVDYIYKTARDIELPKHKQGHGVLCLEKLVEAINSEKNDRECSGQEFGQATS